MIGTNKAILIKEDGKKVVLSVSAFNSERMVTVQASGPTRYEASIHLTSKLVHAIGDLLDEEKEIQKKKDERLMKRNSEKKIKHPRII
jgi:hypothetical protein